MLRFRDFDRLPLLLRLCVLPLRLGVLLRLRFALLAYPYDLSSYSVSDIVGLYDMMLGCSTDAAMECF